MPLTYEVADDELLVTIRGDFEPADEWRAILGAVQRDQNQDAVRHVWTSLSVVSTDRNTRFSHVAPARWSRRTRRLDPAVGRDVDPTEYGADRIY